MDVAKEVSKSLSERIVIAKVCTVLPPHSPPSLFARHNPATTYGLNSSLGGRHVVGSGTSVGRFLQA